MDEDNKIDETNMPGNPPAKEKSKKKEAGKLFRIFKKDSHKDNKCILKGIEPAVLSEFNKGEVITISNEQIKIIGCKLDAEGNITSIPYRWLGVE